MPPKTPALPLFWKILACLVAFVLANVVVYLNSPYFERARGYRSVMDGFASRPYAKLLILGDSHAAQLLNEFLPESEYNAAAGGDGPRELYAKLRYLLDRSGKIETVLLSADAHMFGMARLDSANRAFVNRYLLLTRSPYGLDRGKAYAVMNAIPLFSDEYLQYLKVAAIGLVQGVASAEEKEGLAWNRIPENERVAIARHTGEEDHAGVGMYHESMDWYLRMTELARAHGVKLVLIRYPAHQEYLRTIPAEGLRSVDAGLAGLGLAPILDFSDAFADPALFNDPDHVSREGAKALLKQIDVRLAP